MKPKLIAIYVLIVILPLIVVGWLGNRVARDERQMVQHQLRQLLEDRLHDVDARIAQVVEGYERRIMREGDLTSLRTEALRERVRRLGMVRQFFILDQDEKLVYPSLNSPETATEQAFVERTRNIWLNGQISFSASEDDQQPIPAASSLGKGKGKQASSFSAQGAVPTTKSAVQISKGWHVWFEGHGLNVLFWWRAADNRVVGAEIPRVRLMADIIGTLPDTATSGPALERGRIALIDAKGDDIYQWGSYEPSEDEQARAEISLRPPLGAWKLKYYAPAEYAGLGFGRGARFNMALALTVLAIATLGLATYFYRENAREMREATQRMSFVNKVSHELKTPLTSIRMYAEMLDGELDEQAEKPRRHLGVIVAESQRLSRLIGNVLTFSRKQRSVLKLRVAPGEVDEVLARIIERFEEGLRACGVEIAFDPGVPGEAAFDHDVLEQIVGNLLSNVEKYAPASGTVQIASSRVGNRVTVTVRDGGPGIRGKARRRIFEPFYRVSNKLNDGVAGTGIGLSIARDLARLHGGDLVLEDSPQGACFRLDILAEETKG